MRLLIHKIILLTACFVPRRKRVLSFKSYQSHIVVDEYLGKVNFGSLEFLKSIKTIFKHKNVRKWFNPSKYVQQNYNNSSRKSFHFACICSNKKYPKFQEEKVFDLVGFLERILSKMHSQKQERLGKLLILWKDVLKMIVVQRIWLRIWILIAHLLINLDLICGDVNKIISQ